METKEFQIGRPGSPSMRVTSWTMRYIMERQLPRESWGEALERILRTHHWVAGGAKKP